jgi:hypothetical protein
MRRQAMDSKEMKLKTYVGEGKVPEFVEIVPGFSDDDGDAVHRNYVMKTSPDGGDYLICWLPADARAAGVEFPAIGDTILLFSAHDVASYRLAKQYNTIADPASDTAFVVAGIEINSEFTVAKLYGS